MKGPNTPTKPIVKAPTPTVKTTPSPVPSGKNWGTRHRESAKK